MLLGLAALGALAQTPDPTGYVLRFDVDLVQVDVVVTDSHGNHVPGLKADDFEVLQDGKPQTVTHFSYVAGSPPGSAQEVRADAPVAAIAPTAAEAHRTIVFLIDDVGMSFYDFSMARRAVKRYVDEQMQPKDMVAVMRTSYGSGASQVFTSDASWLSNMLTRMSWHPGGDAFSPPLLADLELVIRGLATYPGRKSIVVIGPGLPPLDSWDPVRFVADEANRASVTIETIDARGLPAIARGGYFQSQAVLSYLAQMTAGRFQHDNNDIPAQVREAVKDGSGYYLLGWYPGPEAFENKAKAPMSYHHVQIRLRHTRGLSARTRDGFFAYTGSRAKVEYSPEVQMKVALFSPFRSGDIDVRLTASLGYDSQNGAYIESLLHVLPRGLVFPDVAGKPECKLLGLEILTTPEPLDFDKVPKGKLNESHARITLCPGKNGLLDEVLRDGIVVAVRDPIVVPGGYRMLAAVRNLEEGGAPAAGPGDLTAGSETPPPRIPVGSANQLIDVPDMRKQDMVLTGIKLEAGNFQEPPQNDAAFYRVASPNDPAVREFHPGETLNYSFRLLRSEKKSTAPAQVSVQILHDGKEVYAAPARAVNPEQRVTGSYRLDASAEAGHYLMRVSSGRATQWINFEVK